MCQGGQTTVAAGATTVEFQDAGEHEDIFVTSEDAVRCVKLRWNYKIPKSARFLGDAWERTYGDAEWHGMSGNRYLPWYFLAKLSGEGYLLWRKGPSFCYVLLAGGYQRNYFVSGCSLRKYRGTAERKKAVYRTDRLHGIRRSRYF